MSVPPKELNKRLDNEAFGPKTDFSVWNFENNYDKMNKEEQQMLVHKMQLDMNNEGYKDYNGHSLKPDGIFGKKTQSAYNQYKNDNKEELEEYEPDDKKIVEGEDYQVLKNEDGKPVLLASTDMNLNGELVSNIGNEITNNPYAPKKLEILPIDFENKEAKKKNQNIDEISKYSTTVQAELLKLKVAWYMAETQEEKDAIHEEANRIRALADSGWGHVLDTAKSITGAAADEFAWLFGGDSSRAERDFWLTQLQKFDPTIEIEVKETLRSLMFIASILAPSPDDAWKMISKKASKEMLKTIGKDGAERFYKAMTKQAAKVNDNGIKKLSGKGVRIGNKYYQYEVKVVSSKIGKYRLLGNIDDSGNLVLEAFEKMH